VALTARRRRGSLAEPCCSRIYFGPLTTLRDLVENSMSPRVCASGAIGETQMRPKYITGLFHRWPSPQAAADVLLFKRAMTLAIPSALSARIHSRTDLISRPSKIICIESSILRPNRLCSR